FLLSWLRVFWSSSSLSLRFIFCPSITSPQTLHLPFSNNPQQQSASQYPAMKCWIDFDDERRRHPRR
ncbi:unnamed protein product, partial [Fusarium fujikuroi]